MSGHADRIGSGIGYGTTRAEHDAAFAALDALLAEIRRYEKALEQIAKMARVRGYCACPACKALVIAREALAGDTE